MILPTKTGPYEIPNEVVGGLYAKYRGIDVHRELQLMALWLAKNPASLPAKPIRFIENWLRKQQARTPRKNGVPHRPVLVADSTGAIPQPSPPFPLGSSSGAMAPTPSRIHAPQPISQVINGLRAQLKRSA